MFLDLEQSVLVFPYKNYEIHIEKSEVQDLASNVFVTFKETSIFIGLPCLKKKDSVVRRNVPFKEVPSLVSQIEKEIDIYLKNH